MTSNKKSNSKRNCTEESDENDERKFPFPVGTLVTVESRTWPGINEPGGPGKVIRSYKDSDGVDRVDVRYVLRGQTEKNIEIIFVSKQSYLEKKRNRRRPTNMNIGHSDSNKQKNNAKRKSCKDGKEVTETKTSENNKRKGIRTNKPVRSVKKVKPNPTTVKKNRKPPISPSNDTDEESLENSIPREITIVSCTTSVASLSFHDNNPTIITNDESQKSQRKNRRQKQLSIAAKSNRKLTEYFPRSPSLPLGLASNEKNNKNQCLKKVNSEMKEKVKKTSKSQEKNKSVLKIHEDHNLNSFNIVRNDNKSKEPKAKQKVKQPLKESSNIMMQSREKMQHISASIESAPRPNSTVHETQNLLSTPHQEPIAKALPKPKPVDNVPNRIDLFVEAFVDIMNKFMTGEIQLKDLIVQVNKRMVVNDKFNESEVKECLRELDKRDRVMFEEEGGSIFVI